MSPWEPLAAFGCGVLWGGVAGAYVAWLVHRRWRRRYVRPIY